MRRFQAKHVLTVLAGVLFSAGIFVGLMFFAGIWTLGKTYDVSVYVQNARGIAPYSGVTMAGLEIGKVVGIQRNGPDAVLDLRIDSGPTPLPVDSTVQVRLRTLAGESYVEVTRGHSTRTVPNNGSLGLSQSNPYTDVDQILSALRPPTEGGTRQFFDGFGAGVKGEGQNLNQVLGSATSLINDSLPLTSTLAAQHNQVADIVQNFGAIMNAIGQRSSAIDDFARGARITFGAMAAQDTAMRTLLGRLPGTLVALRRVSGAFGTTAPQIAPVVTRLAVAVDDLSPAIHLLRPAAQSGTTLVQSLGAASPPLAHVLTGLEQLRAPTQKALPEVHAMMCQLGPMLQYISPYGRDIASALENWAASLNPYGSQAHEFLADAHINPANILRGDVVNPQVNDALQTLLNLGIFSKVGPGNGWDDLPGPGHVNNTPIGNGLTGPASFGKVVKFPRVYAACTK